MATKELKYRVGMDIGELRRNAAAAGNSTRAFRKELDELEKKQRAHRAAMTAAGTGMVTFGAAVTLGLGMAANAAIKWESAFTGVRKTVDGSDAEIAALEGELRKLATTLPSTHEEIAGVAEAAGQLGIKRKDIAQFTETMIALGETTNMTAEEAATDLAKFSNIMGTSASDVDRLGSALVALGNDGASTEKDIIEMGLRIAAAGKQIGLTEAEVLGVASALSSLGIEAESGGSSFSTVMIKIASAVEAGSEGLDAFAKVAGMSGKEFADVFRTDASGAIVSFVAGLGKMQRSGQDVFGVLESLGLSEIRVRDALLRSASASDMFTKSLNTGSDAWLENTALADEAAKRYATTESKMKVAGNQIKDALIDIGAAILPVVAGGVQVVGDLVRAWQELPGPLKDVITWIGVAAAGITLFGGAALIATPKILAFRASMTAMQSAGGGFSKALGGFGKFLVGPWGAGIALAVGLLGAFGVASGSASRQQESMAAAGREVADVIREQNGVINQTVKAAAAKKAAESGLLGGARALGIEMGLVTNAVLNQGTAYDDLRGQLQGVLDAQNHEIDQAKATRGFSQERLSQMEAQRDGTADLIGKLEGQRSATELAMQADQDAAVATEQAAGATKEHGDAHAKTAQQIKEEEAALKSLREAFDAIADPFLGLRKAQRDLQTTTTETIAVLKRNGAGLDITTKKGMENQAQLDKQAESMRAVAVRASEIAAAQGGASAGVAAMSASLEAQRPALLKLAQGFYGSKKAGDAADLAARKYVDTLLGMPQPDPTTFKTNEAQVKAELARVSAAIKGVPPKKDVNVGVLSATAIKTLQNLGFRVRTLPDGSVVVRANDRPAQATLNSLIARNHGRVISVGVRAYAIGNGGRYLAGLADGGILRSYADGGIENHRAQIARTRPGTMRMWAEPETQGETYLPWAMSKRDESLKYMRITANAWGYDVVPRAQSVRSFANGGINGGWSGGGGSMRFELGTAPNTPHIARALLEVLRPYVRAYYGGNVQKALGG